MHIAHQGPWPNDLDRLEDRRKPKIQLDEEQAIVVGEPDPTAHLAMQHSQRYRAVANVVGNWSGPISGNMKGTLSSTGRDKYI